MKHILRKTSLITLFMVAATVVATAQQVDSRSRSFTVTKGGTLDLAVSGGDVRIASWEKSEVYVRAEGVSSSDLEYLEMTQSGNTVTVRFQPRRSRSRNVRFDVKLPVDFNAALKTAGGDIELHGSISGKVKGSTAGGDIVLRDVVGSVEMTTSGGDIRTGTVRGNVVLKTSGGDIDVGKVDGEVEVTTSGGDIQVESVGKSLKARTSGGDIKIGDIGGEANVSTAGGDVRVGKVSGRATLSTAGGDVRLRSGSGEVTAKTAGGDVELRDITGTVEAKTAGGDVTVELRSVGKGPSVLSTAGGTVTLHIAENAKATIDATIELRHSWGWGRKDYEIKSDFKADSYDKDDDRIEATYKLNGGGERITLKTSNGNIVIRKLK
ncbi:MAG: DUF4097 domain-containing protein [Ignavibacteria bacterium]|nr:DUF4097 domain-containing protein [Ignavibacteria bacterium]